MNKFLLLNFWEESVSEIRKKENEAYNQTE